MMHYWNQGNFEGLKAVGKKYASTQGYELFGTYCLQKEQGFRKLAIKSIQAFVADVKTRTLTEQRMVAEELSFLSFRHAEIHQLLAHPLIKFLREVLTHWACDEPQNPVPLKWLGYIAGDISFYEKALHLDPQDEICVTHIAQAHLNDVDYQTHHLSESLFIGSLQDACSSLNKAQTLVETLNSQALKAELQKEIEYYKKLLNCRGDYSNRETKEPFPHCKAKGETFNFWSIAYYDQT